MSSAETTASISPESVADYVDAAFEELESHAKAGAVKLLEGSVASHLFDWEQKDKLSLLREGSCCQLVFPPVNRYSGLCEGCLELPESCSCQPERVYGWATQPYQYQPSLNTLSKDFTWQFFESVEEHFHSLVIDFEIVIEEAMRAHREKLRLGLSDRAASP